MGAINRTFVALFRIYCCVAAFVFFAWFILFAFGVVRLAQQSEWLSAGVSLLLALGALGSSLVFGMYAKRAAPEGVGTSAVALLLGVIGLDFDGK